MFFVFIKQRFFILNRNFILFITISNDQFIAIENRKSKNWTFKNFR